MAKRRPGLKRAATGVVLAGSALAAIAWWNSSAHHAHTARAAEPTPANALSPSPSSSPTSDIRHPTSEIPTSQPATQPTATQPLTSAALSRLLMKAADDKAAGRLLDARTLVNTALVTGQLQGADADSAKAFLRELNQKLIFSPDREPGDPWVDAVVLKAGDNLNRISNSCLIPHLFLMQMNGIESDRRIRTGQTIKTLKGPFHAVVNKTAFTLDLYLGAPGGPDSLYITTFKVGLGQQDSTPVGLWKCTQGSKLKNPTYHSPRGQGIIAADDPNNPLGEYWIGLTGLEGAAVGKTSYGIHGTIDPNSIGTMSSMGCIRLGNADIEQVFKMLFEGKSLVRVIE